ncbi:MAG: hypothetical protein HQ521_04500 [Bacteroidetes bacterium]|nr:hypothetical protein [Bacteroidota bacterium]
MRGNRIYKNHRIEIIDNETRYSQKPEKYSNHQCLSIQFPMVLDGWSKKGLNKSAEPINIFD